MLTLKSVPDWFVTKKMIRKLYIALYVDDNILFFNEYFCIVTFRTDEMDILCVNLNNINLDDNHFYEDDSQTIIHVRFLAWNNKRKQYSSFIKETRINDCSFASSKMVGFVHVKRSEKRNRTSFH